MNMHWIDWTIVIVFMAILIGVAVYVKRFNKSVADFLVANRCAGRYLLTVSNGMAAMGAISFAAMFQQYYAAGFSAIWWLMMLYPLYLLFALSGWIYYRYRETRVLTMAQFFEIRYSRRFRVFTGILAWSSGIINMGIFPAVTARLFIYFCGLPGTFSIFGIEGVSTFVTIMIIELSIALAFTFLGGMIAVMVTDFLQGILCFSTLVVVMIFLLAKFEWGTVIESLQMAPENASMLNPFKTTKAEGFNLIFFMIYVFSMMYNYCAWQGNQGYRAAAKNAHEAKMSGIIGQWRGMIQVILLLIIPVCAFTLMHHSNFTVQAQEVNQTIGAISNEAVQKQMLVPIALTKMLPIGLMGLFAASLLAAAISTDDTYLHSWGATFVQDVILPFRKKGFSPKQHIWILRASILFVAVFIFFFSLLFRQNDYILMFMYMTGAIYLGGAGAVIVGGLYWKIGTTAAAWGAMCTGSGLAVSGMLTRTLWHQILPGLQEWFPNSNFLLEHVEEFPYNGIQISFFAAVCAISVYVFVSLWEWIIRRKPAYNLDRMLHRGQYAIKGEHVGEVVLPPTGLKALIPSKEFTRLDKVLYFGLMAWCVIFFAIFLCVTIYHFIWGTTEGWWIKYWTFWTRLIVVLSTGTIIWLAIGGLRDMRDLFRILKTAKRNIADDGRVVGHHSLADETLEKDKFEVTEELRSDAEMENRE